MVMQTMPQAVPASSASATPAVSTAQQGDLETVKTLHYCLYLLIGYFENS